MRMICIVDDCNRPAIVKGRCQNHYLQQWRRDTGRTKAKSKVKHQLMNPRGSRLMETTVAARLVVRTALEVGTIERSPFCYRCGSTTEKLQAHHWDHARPLDVGWFCKDCHTYVEMNAKL